MASAWDFVGGFSDATLDTIKKREAAEIDINKMRALEQLRRETSDYEYNRNKADAVKKVDMNQSYYDATSGKFIMVNSEGQKIGERAATSAEIRADRAGELDIEHKRASIDDIAFNNSIAERQLGLQAAGLAEARAARKERSVDGGKDAKLYSLAQHVIKDAADQGLDPTSLARVQSDLYSGITTGKYDEKAIRRYQATLMSESYTRDLPGKFATAAGDAKSRAAVLEAKRKKALGL